MKLEDYLDARDLAEFRNLIDDKPISKRFRDFVNRSEALQELIDHELRNDELGVLITEALRPLGDE